jgi:hypothetical protein
MTHKKIIENLEVILKWQRSAVADADRRLTLAKLDLAAAQTSASEIALMLEAAKLRAKRKKKP